jgi:IS30 family transposase
MLRLAAVSAALGRLNAGLHWTVTFDRGFEFMGYPALNRRIGVTDYFCNPRSPWRKDVVENTNKRLRRALPSKASAERLSTGSLYALAGRTNAAPVPGAIVRPQSCSMAILGPL